MEPEHWAAGSNTSGYLPNPDNVQHGLTLEEARESLKEELQRAADEEADRERAEDFDRARQRIGSWNTDDMLARARIHGVGGGDNFVAANGDRYWVYACFVHGCTQVNTNEGPALVPIPGATPVYDENGNEVVTVATCGHCGRSWNDAAISSLTPVPGARCPFEYEHEEE